jgi:L-alanine-DL-glutamate epimerase-like enolase superfamily enzyme
LHVSLTCAVPNALYLEHIPQLRTVTTEEMAIVDGHGVPSSEPGIGISWDLERLDGLRVA